MMMKQIEEDATRGTRMIMKSSSSSSGSEQQDKTKG